MKISFIYGASFFHWIRILALNGFRVSFRYIPNALLHTAFSIIISFFGFFESLIYGRKIEKTEPVEPPVIILGHWRSGTTHLHNIMSMDEQFGVINTFQTLFPRTFLLMEGFFRFFGRKLLNGSRPQDNVQVDWESPQEDEPAFTSLAVHTPGLVWSFPQNEEKLRKYITYREATESERDEWRRAFRFLVKKLTYKKKKALVLKGPTHTGRIKMILDVFPDARFVHIVRNPYKVYQSTFHLFETFEKTWLRLQDMPDGIRHERVLSVYNDLHDSYFAEEKLIPKNQFYFIKYEDLVKNPMKEVSGMYKSLGLNDFDKFKPTLQKYIDSIADYKKNKYNGMDPELKKEIYNRWKRNFKAWGYPSDLK